MSLNDLLSEIGRVLSPAELAQVLTGLRQDPLIWQGIEQADASRAGMLASQAGAPEGETGELLAGRAPGWPPGPANLRYFSAGQMALLALGETRPAEALRAEPMPPLSKALQERALQAYQVTQQNGQPPSSLQEAGLLALALRERRRLVGAWNGLLQEIAPGLGVAPGSGSAKTGALKDKDAARTAFAIWRAPLACLYALVPDPEEMLRCLLAGEAGEGGLISRLWMINAQLSQPFCEADHAAVFTRLLQGLPAAFQLDLLRILNLHGRESLAAALATRLLVNHPAFASLRSQTNPDERDLNRLADRALLLQQMGSFYQVAGDQAQALSLFSAAETTLKQWQAGLCLQRLNLQVEAGGSGTGMLIDSGHVVQLAGSAGWLNNALGVVLVSHPYSGVVIDRVAGGQGGAFLELKRARQMFQTQNEPAVARDLARQCAAGMVGEIRRQGMPFSGDFVFSWQPEDAVGILLELGLPDEAAVLAQALLELRPVDVELFYLSSRIQERLGNISAALGYARSAAALVPDSAAGHRLLGGLWAKAGEWDAAFVEWQAVMALSETPAASDRLACAQVALQAGRLDEAVQLSEAVLQEEANNGGALGILGQALVARGEVNQAVPALVRSTLLSPENLAPWLVLARVQAEHDEPRRALETLRAAVTAVPDAAQGHLALGEACVANGLLAEALPHLKRAFTLAEDAGSELEQSALLYGRTLRQLGHSNEARGILEKLRPAWTNCPELAYEYAQVLLDLNNAESALPVLDLALRNGLPVLEASLLYARILLGEFSPDAEEWDAETVNERLQQARQALHSILEAEPNNLEARFLMADILRAKGELEEALTAYRALAELPAAEASELRWRVQWGLGRTALQLGETDIALAALKEASHIRPEYLPVQRSVAEVSLLANLPQEALEAAEQVLELTPDDVESLAWFANISTRAGDPRRTVEALKRAVQLSPERSDLLVSLAGGQASLGDLAAARASLEAVVRLAEKDRGKVQQEDMRRAAHVYLRMEDTPAALACYERALQCEENALNAPGELLFEIAQLHERMGDLDSALNFIQQASAEMPDSLQMHLFQVNLLVRMERPNAALAVLERALQVAQPLLVLAAAEGEEGGDARRMLIEIHERFTQLMIQSGDLTAALHHAEKALAYRPGSAAICYRAADLALAQLQTERARNLVESFLSGAESQPAEMLQQGREGLELLCLRVEMMLAGEGLSEETASWVELGLKDSSSDARLLAARSRMLLRQGDLAGARRVYQTAQLQIGKQSAPWLADAALELERWKDACVLFERCAVDRPGEARSQLGLARALVLSAERQRLCELTGCRTNAPGPQALNEESRQKFEEAIRTAGRLAYASAAITNTGEIGRWQARGQAVFSPSTQTARALASITTRPEDIAALIAVLRQIGNRTAAVQVAKRYPEHGLVLLHLATCYLETPKGNQAASIPVTAAAAAATAATAAADGLSAAGRAVAANPDQPLAHVVRAMILYQGSRLADPAALSASDLLAEALHEYESALQIWSNEPGWHDIAGDLCMQMGDMETGSEHYQEALAIEPENARFAFKLGQACLAQDDIPGAITCLEKSTALDLNQADAWRSLATTYQKAGRLPQALEAAQKAGDLQPASAESLLIAGQVALAMNQVEQALVLAQGAARREPENASAVLFLSNVLVLRGQIEEGLAALEQAAPAVKSFFPVAFERARLIYRLHGPQPAVDVLEKLVKDYPEEPGLLSLLAHAQAECGEVKAAERYAFRALRIDPNQPALDLMLGRLSRASGHLDQAVHLLSEAIRLSPGCLEAYLELGMVYQERREYSQALEVYRQAMHAVPGDYQAFYQSGLILRDSKDYTSAEAMLRRAAELAPNNLSIRRQMVAVIALNLVHNKQEVNI